MMYGLGTVSLSDVTYGTLNAGVVPNGRLIRTSAWNRNLAGVTIPAGGIEVLAGTSLTVAALDLIMVYALCIPTKGGVAGRTEIRLNKVAGTAVIVFLDNGTYISEMNSLHPNGAGWPASLASMLRVTTGGTLTMRIWGISLGSDSVVAINGCQIGVWVLAGS